MSKTLIGTVVSDKVDKTIVISVHERKTHPLYKKQYSVSTKFMAHDPENQAKLGDTVVITETRPLSARKRFILDKVVSKAAVQHVEAAPELPEKTKPAAKPKAKEEPKAKEVKKEAKEEAKE